MTTQVLGQEVKGGEVIPGQYIVLLEEPEITELVSQSYQLESIATYQSVFNGMVITATEDQLTQLREEPRVIAIEPDRVVIDFAQDIPTEIDRVDADIAILDTGIDMNHPDLDVVEFVNFVRGSSNDDQQGHGSHVAGISAALDNEEGVVGIAPGARLWAVKVLGDNGQGSTSSIISGIDYVTQHADEIEVANMSLGGEFSSDILDQAISNSVSTGVIYVVAAGNDRRDAGSFSPASHPEVVTVSAIADSDGKPGALGSSTSAGGDDSFATFSNFGPIVDIAAPGVDIQSTFRDGSYAKLSGTSMASPHVAGIAALYVAQEGRDLNNDGINDERDVSLFRDLLSINGVSQDDSNGFSGDPDDFAERLANAERIEVGPNLKISATPSTVILNPTDSAQVTLTLSAIGGFTGVITLDALTSSNDVTANLSNTTIVFDSDVTSATSNLTIGSSEGASGEFTITVNSSSSDGTVSRSITIPVNVQEDNGGGCLIATAAYGTELAPQVQLLREIRDNTVMSTSSGAAFMTGFNQLYYSFSPTIADWERENLMFQETVRALITPMISTLSIMSLADNGSEIEILGLGMSVIALNLGMYVVAPMLVAWQIKRRI